MESGGQKSHFASAKEAISCFPGQASPGAGFKAVLTFQVTTQHPEEFPGQERRVVWGRWEHRDLTDLTGVWGSPGSLGQKEVGPLLLIFTSSISQEVSDTWMVGTTARNWYLAMLFKDCLNQRLKLMVLWNLWSLKTFFFFLNCIFSFYECLGRISSGVRTGTVMLPLSQVAYFILGTLRSV